jgi:hypothetical protein
MGLALMRPSVPHLIVDPFTLGEVCENIKELSNAVAERIKMIPAYKTAKMPIQIRRMKEESRHYLILVKAEINKLEKELAR